MSSSSSGRASGTGNRSGAPAPAQLLDALKRGFSARVLPLTAETQAAAEADLRRQMADEQAPDRLGDELTNLTILRREAARYERRWRERIDDRFKDWPRQIAGATRTSTYALLSEDELRSQLTGQPVIEALERRFKDVIGIIDSRLRSLAAAMGGQSRPGNPFAPRELVECLLDTFVIEECEADLRLRLLRHYERLCGDRLGEVYAWLNVQLADAGYAMSAAGDYAMLIAQPAAGAREGIDHSALWSEDNALRPTESTWRRRRDRNAAPGDATRGNLMRQRARAVREEAARDGSDTRREFSDKEFLSVLSLLQGNETPEQAIVVEGAVGPHLRAALVQGTTSLGISPETATTSPVQADAIDVVGALFDGLRAHAALSAAADAKLMRLAWPYLRLALDDPHLFDRADSPALSVLSNIVALWDGNTGVGEPDAELHALADAAADAVANDYHGDEQAFERALAALETRLEPLRKRSEIAERRAWQSILGRERLQLARAQADALLAQRFEGCVLLPSVAQFLSDQWRHSLVHALVRDGPTSARFHDAVAIGDAILRIDMDAAHARGNVVAEALNAVAQPLRNCYVACGLDESGANMLLAALVSELARPDAVRSVPEFTPLAGEGGASGARGVGPWPDPGSSDADTALEAGQVVLQHTPGAPARWLRVAWVSPASGRHLLVDRQGARYALLTADEVAAGLAVGTLTQRSLLPAVEAVLRELSQ